MYCNLASCVVKVIVVIIVLVNWIPLALWYWICLISLVPNGFSSLPYAGEYTSDKIHFDLISDRAALKPFVAWFLTLEQVYLSFFSEKRTADSKVSLLSFKSAAIFSSKIPRMPSLKLICQKYGMLQKWILWCLSSVKRARTSRSEIRICQN